MTDDKDALDSLKELRGWMEHKATRDYMRSHDAGDVVATSSVEWWIENLDPIIAAWEKERADERAAFHRLDRHCAGVSTDLAALRAAVEKVRDELRSGYIPTVAGFGIRPPEFTKWADALDAALRGGE